MNLTFEVMSKPWWRESPPHHECTSFLIRSCLRYRQVLRSFKRHSDSAELLSGFNHIHRINYIKECLSAESQLSYDSETLEALTIMEPNPNNRIHIKVWNLNRAINRYFNSDFFDAFEMQQFTPALAKDINISLLSGLEDRAGIYRQLWAMPAQEDFYYLDPQKISNRLDELFENVVKKYRDSYGWDEARRMEHLVKLGAAFLEEFLYIHPFSNGNGRTGRILLSLLLSEFSVIPVSLFLRQMDREDYLKCLREARLYDPKCPMALARFILDSVDRTLRDAVYCLDLYEELHNHE